MRVNIHACTRTQNLSRILDIFLHHFSAESKIKRNIPKHTTYVVLVMSDRSSSPVAIGTRLLTRQTEIWKNAKNYAYMWYLWSMNNIQIIHTDKHTYTRATYVYARKRRTNISYIYTYISIHTYILYILKN